ncbi:molybdenum cofactor cytidylyltransferase [Thermoflavimicrobium dichotomicum]|uniref:Molybdenum cofactor cytidylyltransferase n=2 Tax=Thermoflavimicrobium dichotomicum TaxID=46223 RepID=A0A1I3S8V1_9BACL|nr:molybdenum cofactor cytidylyltransferase [Thermoflavimicrobium dichotomicum]
MYTAILLAAGRSSRMGRPKGLLQWNEKPLIRNQLEQLGLSRIHKIIVVLGYKPEVYEPFMDHQDGKITVLWNENWEQGKSSSILKGLSAIDHHCRAILFVNIDQPVSSRIVNQLIDSYEKTGRKIHIPVFQHRKGHPVLISTELLEALYLVNEESQGLKSIIRAYQEDIELVHVEDPSVLYNFNTPADLKGEWS